LLEALERIDDGRPPIADVVRRLGAAAEAAGETRPSYERIRQLVHESRALPADARRGPSRLRLALEVSALRRSRESAYRELERESRARK
jgi:hypothetical protein